MLRGRQLQPLVGGRLERDGDRPAEDITNADDPASARLRSLGVEPMAPGKHLHWLALRADEVSGRIFRSGWAIPGAFLG